MATAAAKAAAEAEWPEGNDAEVGILISRASGSPSADGRLRRKACLPTRLTSGLARLTASSPLVAARRNGRRPLTANAPATPAHSRELSAARDSAGTTRSRPGNLALATMANTLRSSLLSRELNRMRHTLPRRRRTTTDERTVIRFCRLPRQAVLGTHPPLPYFSPERF
ncbi:hypothetical protein GCM10009525_23290 [Streptosporangium amethystogenes subsp. fukuiense]